MARAQRLPAGREGSARPVARAQRLPAGREGSTQTVRVAPRTPQTRPSERGESESARWASRSARWANRSATWACRPDAETWANRSETWARILPPNDCPPRRKSLPLGRREGRPAGRRDRGDRGDRRRTPRRKSLPLGRREGRPAGRRDRGDRGDRRRTPRRMRPRWDHRPAHRKVDGAQEQRRWPARPRALARLDGCEGHDRTEEAARRNRTTRSRKKTSRREYDGEPDGAASRCPREREPDRGGSTRSQERLETLHVWCLVGPYRVPAQSQE